MSVLSREALEESPLSDLHLIASELGLDGFRRLRKADLIDRIVESQGGEAAKDERPARPRSGESRSRSRGESPAARRQEEREERRSERSRGRDVPDSVEGKLNVNQSGSGFVKIEGSSQEVYVSAAQIRRLELKDGDRVKGPVRPPRRSERHPSLVRVEAINGKNADEVAPAPPRRGAAKSKPTLPTERFELVGSETLSLIDRVAPVGRGSRVVFTGGPHSGKSHALRQLAVALSAIEGVQVNVALLGVRSEETAEWEDAKPAVTETLDSSPDTRAKSLERIVDAGRRAASKGSHAVVLVDSVDSLPPASVRKALAGAGVQSGGGSLTVAVVSRAPLGGETTVVTFDQAVAAAGKFPSIDVRESSTMRPELLLDPRSLKSLQKAHADAVKKRR